MADTKKKYWKTVSPRKIKNQMKKLSDARWEDSTAEQRSKHARMMALARWRK